MQIKEIPQKWKRGQFDYTLKGVAYTPSTAGGVALYEQRIGDRLVAYEVIVARWRETVERFGTVFKRGYYLPASSQWGKDGFTFLPSQEGEAKKRFYDLIERERKKDEEKE